MDTRSIVLMGIKHCGKTTQGKRIAKKLNALFFDTDDVIGKITGRSPREIYLSDGKAGFMLQEKLACAHIVKEAGGGKCVVATGGGICDNAEALGILRQFGVFVFLQAEERIAADRILREARFVPDGAGGAGCTNGAGDGGLHKPTGLPDSACGTGAFENLPAYIASENPRTEKEARDIFHKFYLRRVEEYSRIADISVCLEKASREANTQKILLALGINSL